MERRGGVLVGPCRATDQDQVVAEGRDRRGRQAGLRGAGQGGGISQQEGVEGRPVPQLRGELTAPPVDDLDLGVAQGDGQDLAQARGGANAHGRLLGARDEREEGDGDQGETKHGLRSLACASVDVTRSVRR